MDMMNLITSEVMGSCTFQPGPHFDLLLHSPRPQTVTSLSCDATECGT